MKFFKHTLLIFLFLGTLLLPNNVFSMPGGGGGCTMAPDIACGDEEPSCDDPVFDAGTGGSVNCETASIIDTPDCISCISGTTENTANNEVTDFGACGLVDGLVWFTFIVQDPNINFTLTPGTLADPVLAVKSDNFACDENGLDVVECEAGATAVTADFGFTIGQEVRIAVGSSSDTDGTFDLCVEQTPPLPTEGNTCNDAIVICETEGFSIPLACASASGVTPSCFSGAPNQDVWITFEILEDGTLEWQGVPDSNTEFDWALWETGGGCPGTEVSCNYDFSGHCGDNFGMINGQGGTDEFEEGINVSAGEVYAIQIDNFSGNGNGFSFEWLGTALITPVAEFTVSDNLSCTGNLTIDITHTGVGNADYDFDNGNTYSGQNPPDQSYGVGSYVIRAVTTEGVCSDIHTEFINVYEPLDITVNAFPTQCDGPCDGSVIVSSVSGGDGIYTYSWEDNGGTVISTNNSVENLCEGDYTVTVSNVTCGTSISNTVNVGVIDCCELVVNAGDNDTVCFEQSVLLNGSFTEETGTVVVEWTSVPEEAADDLSATNVLNPTFTPSIDYGDVIFTLSVTDDLCTIPDNITITVNPILQSITCPIPPDTLCDIADYPPFTYYQEFIDAGGSVTIDPAGAIDTTSLTVVSEVSDNESCPETITRTYSITDSCGVVETCQQIITVGQLTAVAMPANDGSNIACLADTVVPTAPVIQDNCTRNLDIVDTLVGPNPGACGGEKTYTFTYEDCANATYDWVYTYTIESEAPTFTISSTDPTVCSGSDGTITLNGLDPNTDYSFSYDGGGFITITTDENGTYTISGLEAGSYGNFIVADNDCAACFTEIVESEVLTDPNPPFIDAGVDQQVCSGTAVTLLADVNTGTDVTWDNGVVDGDPFTATATTTYTATGDSANCIATDQVTITVYDQPNINSLDDQEHCDSYELPAITGNNLTGDEAYFTETNGGGTEYAAGTTLNFTDFATYPVTLYIYDETGTTPNCYYEDTFELILHETPNIDKLADQEHCDSIVLPEITGASLSGNESYYTSSIMGGTAFSAGDVLVYSDFGTFPVTLYIYDETGSTPNCFDEDTLELILHLTPEINAIANQEACATFELPAITGTNLTGLESYYTAINGAGTAYAAGTTLSYGDFDPGDYPVTLYIYDETNTTPNCSDEESFTLTIYEPVNAGDDNSDELCNVTTIDLNTLLSGDADAGGTWAETTTSGQFNAGTGVLDADGLTPDDYVFTYTVTEPGACPDDVATFTITVNGPPVANDRTPTLCEDVPGSETADNVDITENNSSVNGTGDVTFTWYEADGTTLVGDPTNVTVSNNDVFIVEVVHNTTGCENTATITYTVTDNITLTDPDLEFCEDVAGEGEYLVADLENYNNQVFSGTATYVWAEGPTDVTVTNGYTVNVAVTQGSCPTVDIDVSFVVNPLPTATIAGDNEVCVNDAEPDITFTGADGTAPYRFTYTINGGADQTVNSDGTGVATVSVPTTTDSTFVYELVSVSDGTDTECSQAQTGSVTVVVNPLPEATIAGDTTVCVDDTAPEITFTGSNGTAPYTFTYTLDGGADQTVVSDGTGVATVAAPTTTDGSFVYELVSVEDATATTCSQAQTGSATVVVNPLPTATIAGDNEVCVDAASPQVTFTGANGTTPYSFVYSLNGEAPDTIVSTGSTATINVPTTTDSTYVYELISVSDASTTNCEQNQTGTATVIVNPLPTATIAGDTTVCVDDIEPTVTFTGANGTAPYTFSYRLNGGAQQTITSDGTGVVTLDAPTGTAGEFEYTLVSVEDATTTTCSQTQTGLVTITVNPLPTASISGNRQVCVEADEPIITFSGFNGTAPYTFEYTIDDGTGPVTSDVTTETGESSVTVTAPTIDAGVFEYALVSVTDGTDTECSQTQTGTVTITVNPLPTATIAGDTAVCLGDDSPEVTFQGADGTAPYTFTYTINGGGNQTVVSDVTGEATVAVPTGTADTYTYELVSVQDASTTSCSQTQTGTAIITVNPLPNPSSIQTAICEDTETPGTTAGVNITIHEDSINGTTGFNYTYYTDAGLTNPVANPTDVTVSNGDIFYVEVENTSTNCTAVATITYEVEPLPEADAGGSAVICENGSHTVVGANAANGTIEWTHDGEGTLEDTTTLTPTYSAVAADAGNTVTLTMTVTSDNACNPEDATATYTIDVDPLPEAVAGGSGVICENEEHTVSGASSNYGDILWTHNGAGTLEDQTTLTPTYIADEADGGNDVVLTLTVTSDNSCNPEIAQATYTITVNPIPDVVASASDIDMCEDETTTLLASGADTYVWEELGEEESYTVSPEDTTTYVVTGTAEGCSATDSVTINVNYRPMLSFAADVTEGCIPTQSNFTSNSDIPLDPDKCVWTLSNGDEYLGCDRSIIFGQAGCTDITFTATSTAGCTNSVTYDNYVCIEGFPSASFTADPMIINDLDPVVTFTNTSLGAVDYEWSFGDFSGVSEEENPSYEYPKEEGRYNVRLIAYSEAGCPDTTGTVIEFREELIFYIPNTFTPDGNAFNEVFQPVFTSGFDPMDYKLLIFNRWGEVLFESNNAEVGWDGTYGGKVVQDGTYIWKIEFKKKYTDDREQHTGHVNLLR